MSNQALALRRKFAIILSGLNILRFLLDLNQQGFIAAMYLADEITEATYTGAFAGDILRNAGYTEPPGPELVTNGDFSAWTADDPDGWLVIGEVGADPEVTERASGNLNGDPVGAGGACNMFSSATGSAPRIQQVILTLGETYEAVVVVSAYGSGILRSNQLGFVDGQSADITAVGTLRHQFVATSTTYRIRQSGASGDFTIASVSVRKVGELDALLTSTTWGANGGVVFNGTTSLGTIANNAALANLTAQAWAVLANAASLGEANKGSYFNWGLGGANDHLYTLIDTEAVRSTIFAATTNASAKSNNNEITNILGNDAWMFMDFDDDNVLGNGRRARLHKGLNGAVNLLPLATNIAADGAVTNQVNDLILGNVSGASLTFDGTMNKIIVFNANAIAIIDSINAELTRLAGV